MDICSARSWPEIDHDSGDSTDPNQESEPLSVEEGDRILATGLFPHPSMNIRASSTISQRLAEAHQANMEALNPIPEYLKEFTSVFSKQLFDTLPEPKEWDHVVELMRSLQSPTFSSRSPADYQRTTTGKLYENSYNFPVAVQWLYHWTISPMEFPMDCLVNRHWTYA